MYVLYLCIPEKMGDRGRLASISLYLLSFIPLFAASGQAELTLGCVLQLPAVGTGCRAGRCSAVRGAAGRN